MKQSLFRFALVVALFVLAVIGGVGVLVWADSSYEGTPARVSVFNCRTKVAVPDREPGPDTTEDISLYVVVKVAQTQRLLRIIIDQKKQLRSEVVLVMNCEPGQGACFFSFIGAEIIDHRYLVSEFGGIVDLRQKRIIHDERKWGRLLNADPRKVVYGVFDTSVDGRQTPRDRRGIFVFDLQTEKLQKLDKAGPWGLPGVRSPNNTLSVSGEDTVYLHYLNGTSKILAKGFQIKYDVFALNKRGLPFLWLDNEHILTQKENGLLVVLDIKGNMEVFAKIERASGSVFSAPELWTDLQKRIVYSCGLSAISLGKDLEIAGVESNEYFVDVKAKAAIPLEKYALGNGFEAPIRPDKGLFETYHDGKLFGKCKEMVRPGICRTGPGVIALRKSEKNGQSIAVWSARVGEWREIGLEGDLILIGWLKDQ